QEVDDVANDRMVVDDRVDDRREIRPRRQLNQAVAQIREEELASRVALEDERRIIADLVNLHGDGRDAVRERLCDLEWNAGKAVLQIQAVGARTELRDRAAVDRRRAELASTDADDRVRD